MTDNLPPPPNPFADDARVVQAERGAARSQSPVDNPYAAPAGQADDLPAAVGTWRDGKLLVVHREAKLPAWCIGCGELAAEAYELVLPLEFGRGSLLIMAGFCARCGRRHRSGMQLGYCGYLPLGVGLFAANCPLPWFAGLSLAAVVAWVALSIQVSRYLFQLQLHRRQEPYFAVLGANPRFLARLPPLELALTPRAPS